jgi:hypothetical protein
LAARHPCVRDALVWCVPALVAGGVLRLLLLAYQPYAYWGSDSGSYFWFAQRLLLEGQISLPAKRQFLYPIFLVPVAVMPGAALAWLAWLQHALGLVTVCAVGYCVRKLFGGWKVWVVPVTVLFACLPVLIWYEHELIGEPVFAHALAWAFAGWLAWDGRGREAGAWWLFLVPFAVCVLTKSAGRFFWPGIVLGLVATRAWRHLRWPQWVATAVLAAVSWTMGEGSQGIRLLYTSAFPLTVLDSPAHAALKAEIHPMVSRARAGITTYHLDDSEPKDFLRTGLKDKERYPAWAALARDQKRLWGTVKELALEAVAADPAGFAGIAGRRAVAAMDLSGFRAGRFSAGYYARRFKEIHKEILERGEAGGDLTGVLFGRRAAEAMADGGVGVVLSGQPEGLAGCWELYAAGMHRVVTPVRTGRDGGIRVTLAGWWLVAALVLAMRPSVFPRLGVWLAVVLGYALGVHLLGSSNPRFLVPIWSVLCVAAALPAEELLRVLRRARRNPAP